MEKKKRTTYKEPKFFLDKKEAKVTGIFLKYSFGDGKRITFYTGQRIEPAKWSFELQRVKRNVTGASDQNDILNHISETAVREVRQATLKGHELTMEELRDKLNEAIGKKVSGSDFFNVFDSFVSLESNKKSWTNATLQTLATLNKHLKAFEVSNKQELSLSGFDNSTIKELVLYFQEAGLRNSTIHKMIKLLAWFFSWCEKNGHTAKRFKPDIDLKQASHKVVFLSMEEIKRIYTLEPQNNYLERTKDIFTFQCLTGLRFSDLQNLKAVEIQGTTISVNTIKTGEVVEIELTETTRAILDKYKQHQEATGRALPVPANQVYNRFLKQLAKLAGLNEKIQLVHYKGSQRIEETFEKWQLVCTHTARRSFVTNGLFLGISSETLRSWTGHQNDKSFSKYYEVVRQLKQTDMAKFTL